MLKKKGQRKKIKTKLFISSSIVLCLLILGFVYIELVVNPIIVRITEAQVDALATTAVSDAIFEVVNSRGIDYSDLVTVTYDSDNKISSISSNMEKMNYLAREISTVTQILLDDISGEGVKVSLGVFTGIDALTQIGPDVNLQLMPIGSVITKFNSKFESAGINQTRHALYIDVDTTMCVILPTSSKRLSFVTSALVCENIIVGKVPNVYLQGLS